MYGNYSVPGNLSQLSGVHSYLCIATHPIESSTYTAYSRFTGWDGSSTYNIKLYLYSINEIRKIIFYGSQWLALPVDSKGPNYISVNGQRFRVKTVPGEGDADFSYFGTGVYYISVPVVTTTSLIDVTFECDSYYSLLLSEIELIARSASGVDVQLNEQIYFSNGTALAVDNSSVFTPEPLSNQSASNNTFPTIPTTRATVSPSGTPVTGASSPTGLDLTLLIPFSIATILLLVIICSLILISLLLCCKVSHLKRYSKSPPVSPSLTTPVVENRHYIPSTHSAVNPQLQQAAYESIASFDSTTDKQELQNNLPESTRYSMLKKTYNVSHSPVKEPLSSPNLRTEKPPNSGYDDYPVPNPMYNLTRRDVK